MGWGATSLNLPRVPRILRYFLPRDMIITTYGISQKGQGSFFVTPLEFYYIYGND